MPIVLIQGNKIRKTFPRLPEAKNPIGVSGSGAPFRLISLGESSMAGVGIDTHENGFTGNFSSHLSSLIGKQINWRVYAKSGLTAKQVKETLVPKVEEHEADLILIALGGNDTFQLNSSAKWEADIKSLIESLKSKYPSTLILFATMPPIHTFPAFTGAIQLVLGRLVSLHGQTLQKLVEQYENVYFDPQKIDLGYWLEKYPGHKQEEFYSDGLHPSSLTFELWGKELAELFYAQHISID